MGLKLGLRDYEKNRVLGIFGPKRDEVTGRWRELHNEGFHELYSSPNIVGIIISGTMRRVQNSGRKKWREETTCKT
jgi:hypothetical protein